MTRWGGGVHRERRQLPRGSRDPIREYLENERDLRRQRIASNIAVIISALFMCVVVWLMLTVIFAVYAVPVR